MTPSFNCIFPHFKIVVTICPLYKCIWISNLNCFGWTTISFLNWHTHMHTLTHTHRSSSGSSSASQVSLTGGRTLTPGPDCLPPTRPSRHGGTRDSVRKISVLGTPGRRTCHRKSHSRRPRTAGPRATADWAHPCRWVRKESRTQIHSSLHIFIIIFS